MRVLLVVSVAVVLAGCRNACQRLCLELSDYAAQECGMQFPEAQVKACVKGFSSKNVPESRLEDCENSLRTLSSVDQEWPCEDVAEYFDEPAPEDDTAE